MDGVEHLLQQNWEHVKTVVSAVNALPASSTDTDFSRVREWNLAGAARHFRQTVLFAAYDDPALSALMRRPAYCANASGGLVVRADYGGTIGRVACAARQVFARLPSPSLAGDADARLAHFRAHLLPSLATATQAAEGALPPHARGTLIFVPSYLDYVRVRNALDGGDCEFATACEYSEDADVGAAKASFARGDTPTLLITERFHFFRRPRLRGVARIIMYAPPSVPHFYPELANMLADAAAAGAAPTLTVMFSRFDAQSLERVLGTQRAARLLAAEGPQDRWVFV